MKGPIQASQRDRQTTFAVALDPDLLRPLTNLKRDQVWGASLKLDELDELDELDDLGRRIERASTYSSRRGGHGGRPSVVSKPTQPAVFSTVIRV